MLTDDELKAWLPFYRITLNGEIIPTHNSIFAAQPDHNRVHTAGWIMFMHTNNVSALLCTEILYLVCLWFCFVQGGNANVVLLLKRNSEVTLTLCLHLDYSCCLRGNC